MTQDPRLVIEVTDEMLRHSRILDILYFTGFVYGVVELLLILVLGISSRMRDAAARLSSRPYVIALVYVVFFTILTTILGFPFSYYAGYVVPHEFNLSNQNFAQWMGDEGKGFVVGLIFSLIVVPVALLIVRKVRRWWLTLWLASVPLSILLVVIVPVLVDPVFNKFVPLQNPVLKQKLLDEAARAGIEGARVYQVDKSRQTKEMNAYVTGLGPTKRIVLWDTLLAKLDQDEILATMAHEMGHYVLHHLWQGLAWGLAISFPLLFIAQKIYEWGVRRWGGAPGDPVTLPWLLLIVSVGSFLMAPVENGISRHIEHEADRFGLELTHLNEPMAATFVAFAKDSKVNPDPSPFIEFWRYSHPSLSKRVRFALSYHPWQSGAARFSAPGSSSTGSHRSP